MGSSDRGRDSDVLDARDRARFEQIVLPHLDAAYNLARWLLKSRADSQDVAQEAMLRAFRFFGGFNGGDARAWLLQIVRNTCYTWLEKNRPVELMTECPLGSEKFWYCGNSKVALTRKSLRSPPSPSARLCPRWLVRATGCSAR